MFGEIIQQSPVKVETTQPIEIRSKAIIEIREPAEKRESPKKGAKISQNQLNVDQNPEKDSSSINSEKGFSSLNIPLESIKSTNSQIKNSEETKGHEDSLFGRESEQSSEVCRGITPVHPSFRCHSMARNKSHTDTRLIPRRSNHINVNKAKHISFCSRVSESPSKFHRRRRKFPTPCIKVLSPSKNLYQNVSIPSSPVKTSFDMSLVSSKKLMTGKKMPRKLGLSMK